LVDLNQTFVVGVDFVNAHPVGEKEKHQPCQQQGLNTTNLVCVSDGDGDDDDDDGCGDGDFVPKDAFPSPPIMLENNIMIALSMSEFTQTCP